MTIRIGYEIGTRRKSSCSAKRNGLRAGLEAAPRVRGANLLRRLADRDHDHLVRLQDEVPRMARLLLAVEIPRVALAVRADALRVEVDPPLREEGAERVVLVRRLGLDVD